MSSNPPGSAAGDPAEFVPEREWNPTDFQDDEAKVFVEVERPTHEHVFRCQDCGEIRA